MTSSIAFTDDIGSVTFENLKAVSRFSGWTPDAMPIGATSVNRDTGVTSIAEFRKDYLSSFEVAHVPKSEMMKMLRLQAHLLRGGQVSVDSDHVVSSLFATSILAPGTKPRIQFSDKDALEYSFGVTLRSGGETNGPDCRGDAFGGDAVYAFALSSEDNIVFFYDAGGGLIASWDSGIAYSVGAIQSLCASRTGTVWAVYTPFTGSSVLTEIDPSDGSVIRTVTTDFRVLDDGAEAARRQVVELANANLLAVREGELWHVNTTTGAVTDLAAAGINGGDDLADTSLDFDINGAGTFLVIADSYDLLLVDLSDGTRTTIKTFDNKIAWPKWLSDCSILVQTSGQNAMQTYQLQNACYLGAGPPPCPTSGTFTLTVGADTTTPLAWNCTGAELVSALEALSSIGAGNVRFETNSPNASTDSIASVGYITFEFCNDLGFIPVAVTLTDSTDNGMVLVEIETGHDTVYDDDAGQFTIGDILRVGMDGTLLRTYRFDQTPYKAEGEGIYQYTASLSANRLWIHLEWDKDAVYSEASGLEILRLSSGAKVASIIPLILTDTDADVSAAAVAPFFARYAP